MGPAEALYSTEFFQQLRQTLAPGGALVLHIGSPVARPDRVAELGGRHDLLRLDVTGAEREAAEPALLRGEPRAADIPGF